MSYIDSEAVFLAKLQKLNLGDLHAEFVARGWKTLGNFAFACPYNPASSDDSKLIEKVIVPLTGNEDDARAPPIRRLHFEAYTAFAEEMRRSQSARDDDEKPQRLPGPERAARFNEVETELDGLQTELEGPLEPSNALVDKLVAIGNSGELRYIRWDELTRRDQEVIGVKKDESIGHDSAGYLRKASVLVERPADVSDNLKLRYALQRRGVAMQMAKLCSYKVHQKVVNLLFNELERDPQEGFYPVSTNQARQADMEIFRIAAQRTRSGLSPNADGSLPLDKVFPEVIKEYRIQALLFPRRIPEDRGIKRDWEASVGFQQPRTQKGKGKGKNKGKGDDSKSRKSQVKADGPRPKELIGLAQDYNGDKFCFSYNMDGCKFSKPGGRCKKGAHRCMIPGCGKAHSQRDHPN